MFSFFFSSLSAFFFTFLFFFFFFNDTATTEIYTLSLHDALPLSKRQRVPLMRPVSHTQGARTPQATAFPWVGAVPGSITMFVVLSCADRMQATGRTARCN